MGHWRPAGFDPTAEEFLESADADRREIARLTARVTELEGELAAERTRTGIAYHKGAVIDPAFPEGKIIWYHADGPCPVCGAIEPRKCRTCGMRHFCGHTNTLCSNFNPEETP